jgi:prepilin-type N-terminal cleavage/methylation domain-containing protein
MIIEAGKTRGSARRGFTLAEATLAMVILGMAAAGVLLPFAGGASVQAEGMHRTLAAALADDLLERIINTPFDEIVATWHGYQEAEGQVRDAGDAILTDPIYARFSRGVSCSGIYVPQESGAIWPDFNFILVRVRVDYGGKEVAAVTRLVSR